MQNTKPSKETMNEFNKFIKENRKFWSEFAIKDNGQKLLIEEGERIYIKSIFAMIINQAKGYIPVWLCVKNPQQHQLIQSYFPDVEIITTQKKWLPRKLYAAIIALFKFVKVLLSKDILGFHYDRVKYGDIIYDMYLEKNKVATIKKIDFKVLKLIATYIFWHIKIKTILQSGNYAGVLVSHMIGSSGVMLRSALRYGYQGYVYTGMGPGIVTLQRLKNLEEIACPYKPSRSDIREIIDQLGPRLNKVFLEVFKKEVAGSSNAFSKNNKYYINRAAFNKDYKLNPNKKNVFIMLHALNDNPHSTFHWMIFKDYYDWFIKTLEFAKKNNRVNWIFKQHPEIKYYPVKDVDFKKLFSKCPDNIIYIDENRQIDTRSLIYCADLVVTCLGSAGFELPAMGAIPSVTAGDSFYIELGFTLEPKTKEEYFGILNRADKIKKITPQAQKRAKAAYIYIYKTSRVRVSIRPAATQFYSAPTPETKERHKYIKPEYWKRVCNQYSTKKNIVLKELNCYIKAVRKPGFKKLSSKI